MKQKLNILYLCAHYFYKNKMSRVRFHSVDAISKITNLTYSGPGWSNWNDNLTVDENISNMGIEPDMILVYKPLGNIPSDKYKKGGKGLTGPYNMKGFSDSKYPKCITYNEMNTEPHPHTYTKWEIETSKADLVICHHENEKNYPYWEGMRAKFVNIPHCAEKTVFKDWGNEKIIDVQLVGKFRGSSRYPLRQKMASAIKILNSKGYRARIFEHPGYRAANVDDNHTAIHFSKIINESKITLSCSGVYKSRYAKYSEIPASRSLLMADMPDEAKDFFSKFMVELNRKASPNDIVDTVIKYLKDNDERNKLTDLGYELTHKHFTQEYYAERFVEEVTKYLEEVKNG